MKSNSKVWRLTVLRAHGVCQHGQRLATPWRRYCACCTDIGRLISTEALKIYHLSLHSWWHAYDEPSGTEHRAGVAAAQRANLDEKVSSFPRLRHNQQVFEKLASSAIIMCHFTLPLLRCTVTKKVLIIGTGSLYGPFWRFGSLLGPYLYFRVPIFSVLASFTRRKSIQSACIQQWVNLICVW